MDETMKNAVTEEINEQTVPVEEEVETSDGDPLKEAIEDQMRKLQRQSMLVGCQVICKTVLDKINVALNQPGKRTMNDYKRLIKDLTNFCTTGLSRKVNADGKTELIDEESTTEETVQN